MDKETEKRALKALAAREKQIKRQNDWTAANRERVAVLFPIGTRDRMAAAGIGSMSSYIADLVLEDLERREKSAASDAAPDDWSDVPFM